MNKWIKIKDNKNPLIVRFTRSGWHLPVIDGVAVTSQILCISITLNKGNSKSIQYEIDICPMTYSPYLNFLYLSTVKFHRIP